MTKSDYLPYLSWIASQKDEMIRLVELWSNINSGSFHTEGLSQMMDALKQSLGSLEGEMQEIELPPLQQVNNDGKSISISLGNALSIRKRPEAPLQILLGGHMDTVFQKESPFQKVKRVDENIIVGPGVADMKGGLVVMLKALQAFEMSPYAHHIGWEILLNPDEEIGSPGSVGLFKERAKKYRLGLLFEPSLPDGSLVIKRKGSANFTLIAKGKSAHSGRGFSQGCNAIHALSALIHEVRLATNSLSDFIFNTGYISGGGAVNVVPDFALCRFNIRSWEPTQMSEFESILRQIQETVENQTGAVFELYKDTFRPPKPIDPETNKLFEEIASSGQEMQIDLKGESTGGATDGNILAEAGLPNLDTLGVRGGKLHTHEEYIEIDSLTERAALTALFLIRMAILK